MTEFLVKWMALPYRGRGTRTSVHGFENRHDFLRPVDRPRVGKGPVVEHAVRSDALQVVALDADVAQPPRQAKPCDEAVEYLGRRLAHRAECSADLRLAIGVDLGVERQHGREHDAGGAAVRHPGTAAEPGPA